MLKKTKIIATIGPSSLKTETIERMYQTGMNGARINTAYGTFDEHKLIVGNVRKISEIPIIIDIKGPEIRLIVKNERTIKEGDTFSIGFEHEEIAFNHDFFDEINVGDYVYIDNGKIRTHVLEKKDRELHLLGMNSGEIRQGMGANIPNKKLSSPTLSKNDLKLIRFAEKLDLEYIALSFVRNAEDIRKIRTKARNFEGKIIAKIENLEGVKNFKEILDIADCIMVARGDLGIEISPEKVPLLQKSIIKKCNQLGKTVIVATEMLESMIHQPTPTRAEVSDIANAILDGTDTIMLSGETAIGKYPVESVTMMSRIAREIETETIIASHVENGKFKNISDAISKSIQKIIQNMPISKIVSLTRSGYTARMITRFKIQPPIIAVTPEKRVKSQLELVFGVLPVHIDFLNKNERILTVAKELYEKKLIEKEDTVLFTAASRTARRHSSNLIEIHKVNELIGL